MTRQPTLRRPGPLGRLLAHESAAEGDRVTTLELFFDLVYVFAFTQVTYLMSHGEPPLAIVEGLVLLALLWWTWTSFAWLSNVAHADRGVVGLAMLGGMTAVFLLSLALPEAFHDLEGGLYAPLVFAVCYLFARFVHLGVYAVVARSERSLLRQILIALGAAAVPSSSLLVVGAALGAPWQLPLWTAAIAFDIVIVYVTGRREARAGGGWRVGSVAHASERWGLIVILALGESIVAIGVGVSREPVDVTILIGAVLAVGLAAGMWWSYFHRLSAAGEHRLEQHDDAGRARLVVEAYTYLHLPVIAGVILAALGVEQVMGHLDDDHAGLVAAWGLAGGVSLYLAATASVWARITGQWGVARFGAAALLLALVPALAAALPLVALAAVLAVVAALAVVEHIVYDREGAPLRTG